MERSPNLFHPGWNIHSGLLSILDETSTLDFFPSWTKHPLWPSFHPGWNIHSGLLSILDETSTLDFFPSWMKHPLWPSFHPGWNIHDVARSCVLKTLPKTPQMQNDDIMVREFLRNMRWMAIIWRFSPWMKIYSRKTMETLLCVNGKNDSERSSASNRGWEFLMDFEGFYVMFRCVASDFIKELLQRKCSLGSLLCKEWLNSGTNCLDCVIIVRFGGQDPSVWEPHIALCTQVDITDQETTRAIFKRGSDQTRHFRVHKAP